MPKTLWAPWRLDYVQHADELDRCIFCEPEEELLVATGEHALAVLNKYPYASGHLLVAPKRHVGELRRTHRRRGARGAPARVGRASTALTEIYRAARVQPRLEHRPGRRRRDRRPRAPARRPALERRHELHAGPRRRQGAARGAARDGAQAARGLEDAMTRAAADRRLPLRRRPLRARRATRARRLLPLHPLPAPNRNGGRDLGADRSRLAAHRGRRGARPRLATRRRRLREMLLRRLRRGALVGSSDRPRATSSSASAPSTPTRGFAPSTASSSAYAAPWEPIPDDGVPRYAERRPLS